MIHFYRSWWSVRTQIKMKSIWIKSQQLFEANKNQLYTRSLILSSIVISKNVRIRHPYR